MSLKDKLLEIGVSDENELNELVNFMRVRHLSGNTINNGTNGNINVNNNRTSHRHNTNVRGTSTIHNASDFIYPRQILTYYTFPSLHTRGSNRLLELLYSMLNIQDIVNQDNMDSVCVPLTENQIELLKISKYNNESEISCSICQNDIVLDSEIIELPCKHIFHKDCVLPWVKEYHHVCALCKADIRDGLTNQEK